jgi:hypothetical protein
MEVVMNAKRPPAVPIEDAPVTLQLEVVEMTVTAYVPAG